MITPPFLTKGAVIGIVATARKISLQEIQSAINLIESLGYRIKLSKYLFSENHQFSGTDQQRASDLMSFFKDKEVDAILCARGGYGTVRLLPYLDINLIKTQAKWLIGYSDITVLHSLLHEQGIASVHATMPINFKDYTAQSSSITSLLDVLEGNNLHYQIQPSPNNRLGKAEGILVGGNLSMLYSLRGTPLDLNTQDKILFIEDLDEYLYHIDRMMMNLKIGGFLDNIKALIVGGMSDMNDNTIPFGKTAEEIILDTVKDYDFPVAFNFPAGHILENLALPFGQNISLDIKQESLTLTWTRNDI